MVYLDSKYKEGDFPFPEEVSPSKKGKKYCIDYASAIYSMHVKNESGIYYSNQEDFYKLRLYGGGNQPEEIYKKYWLNEGSGDDLSLGTPKSDVADDPKYGWTNTPSARRKGYMNVLWKVISTAPKIKAALIGKFQRAEYDIVANAIDAFSGAEKETKKYGLWYLKENKEFLDEFNNKAGIPTEEPELIPETLQELELYDESGGFKPEYAMVMEQIVAHTLDISDFDGVKDKIMSDAIDIGVFGFREYFDKECDKFKFEYVDPENAIIQYSKYYDFRDSEFCGFVSEITVSQLRVNLENDGVDFKEEDLAGIAKSCSGKLSNPPLAEWEKYANKIESSAPAGYNFYKVPIFNAEWVDIEKDQVLIKKNNYGNEKVIKQEYGQKNKKNPKNKTIVTSNRYKYTCSWVIGAEKLAYDFGKAYDILRPTKKSVSLSIHMYKLPMKSITDQLIPLYDNFMNLWVKYQSALASAAPKGYWINMTSLGSVGGENAEEEALKRFIQSGFGFFKETNSMAMRNSTMKPIYEFEGGMGNIFNEIQAGFQLNIQMIEHLTGVSPLALGTVDPNAPVGTSELSYQNTQDTLRPILSGYSTLKERAASNVVMWTQLKIKNDKKVIDAYTPVIGKNGVKVLQIAEKNHVRYGISLEAQPTDFERQEIIKSANISLAAKRDGGAGITQSDYFAILHILNSGGSLKRAEMILRNREAKAERERDLASKENMAIQQQGALSIKQEETKSKLMEIEAKKKADIEVKYAEAVFDTLVKLPADQRNQAEIMELKNFYDSMNKEKEQAGQQQQQQQQQQMIQ